MTGDAEPAATVKHEVKQRAYKAIQNIAKISFEPEVRKKKREWKFKGPECNALKRLIALIKAKMQPKKKKKKPPPTTLSPQLKNASNQGWDMMKKVVFPSLPALLQDLWVYLELLVTLVAFVFGMIGFAPIPSSPAFSYVHLSLTILSMVLALIDAYVYFFELGTCARAIRYAKRRLKQKGNSEEEEALEEEENENNDGAKKKCSFHLSKKWKTYFSLFFELGRNIVSELILYPLLVFDLFLFVTQSTYQPEGSLGRLDFSLFIVGAFYMVLAVYIMRIFVIAGSMKSLVQISVNDKLSGKEGDNSSSLLIKFCLHILGQIVVHFTTIMVIAAKINNENPPLTPMNTNSSANASNSTIMMIMDGSGSGSGSGMSSGLMNNAMNNQNISMGDSTPALIIHSSPFLWIALVFGWLIPIAGISIFFVVNMYWMREFTIGFWIKMLSLLQGASFAETVFGGEGMSAAQEQTLDFIEKSQYSKVKKQLKRFKSPSWWTKFLYPTRVPLAALSGLLYDFVLIVFAVSIMFTYKDGTVQLVVFQDDHILSIMFVISVLSIIIANIHVLILLNMLLIIIAFVAGCTFFLVLAFSPFILLIFLPILALCGYFFMCKDCFSSMIKKHTVKPTKDEGDRISNVYEDIDVIQNKVAVEKEKEKEEEAYATSEL